jgi:hypothetical protein
MIRKNRTLIAAMLGIGLLGLGCSFRIGTAAPENGYSNDKSALGVNVNEVRYYSSEWMFVDIMKYLSGWEGAGRVLDADGWISSLSGGPATNIYQGLKTGFSPSNTFALLWDGDGDVSLGGSCNPVRRSLAAGRATYRVKNPEGELAITISRVNDADHLRNIRLVPVEYEDSYLDQPFHPVFLDQLKKFKALRFMDAMQTVNSSQGEWANRPKPGDAVQGRIPADWSIGKGVAVEYLIRLANTLNADAWFCIPHRASDEYVSNFAAIVRDLLKPGLKAYIEYSNEIWNYGDPEGSDPSWEGSWCGMQGRALRIDYPPAPGDTGSGLYGSPTWGNRIGQGDGMSHALCYQGYRSVQIFNIFDQVYRAGGLDPRAHIIRVLATQVGWNDRQAFILDFPLEDGTRVYQHADALAVNPYFGFTLVSIDNGLANCDADIATNLAGSRRDRKFATARGLMLLAYEAGQSLVKRANPTLARDANRDPGMGQRYTASLDNWKASDGETMFLYNSVSQPGEYGEWGLLEFQGQRHAVSDGVPALQIPAPKYDAVMDWIDANPRWW